MNMEQLTNGGLRIKDISDWLKVAAVIGTMIVGYVRLSDQVAGHTNQIADVQQQIIKMRDENRARAIDTQRKLGAIQMYLCSKDSTRCDPAVLTPPQ